MITFITSLILLISILLIFLILMQSSKDAGGLTASASAASQTIGTRRVADWIEKTTWSFIGILFFLCIIINFFVNPVNNTGLQSPNIDEANKQIIAPATEPNTTDSLNSTEQNLEELLPPQ